MTIVVVSVPVLGRPHRVAPLLESLHSITYGPTLDVSAVLVCSPSDSDQISAAKKECKKTGDKVVIAPWESEGGDFSRKTNLVVATTTADWFLTGADDIEFAPGWLEEALMVHLQTHACVIGTNDAANQRTKTGRHATHFLIHSAYTECGTIDEPDSGKIFCDLYQHNFVDDELVGTARHRETYAHSPLSIVRHFHPNYGTAERDATYEKGQAGFSKDRALFQQRQQLWNRGAPRPTRSGA